MKYLVLGLSLILATSAYAGLVSHTDYVGGQTITAATQNANENAIVNEFNGNIENVNIKSGAAIAVNKLATLDASRLAQTDSSGYLSTTVGTITSGSSITISGSLTTTAVVTASTITFGSFSTGGIKGTVGADDAPGGFVGQLVSSNVPVANRKALTNGQYNDLMSMTLPAGDWDVTFMMSYDFATTATQLFKVGISSSNGNSTEGLYGGDSELGASLAANTSTNNASYGGGNGSFSMVIANYRMNFTTARTIYGKVFSNASAGNVTAFGTLRARRIR